MTIKSDGCGFYYPWHVPRGKPVVKEKQELEPGPI